MLLWCNGGDSLFPFVDSTSFSYGKNNVGNSKCNIKQGHGEAETSQTCVEVFSRLQCKFFF